MKYKIESYKNDRWDDEYIGNYGNEFETAEEAAAGMEEFANMFEAEGKYRVIDEEGTEFYSYDNSLEDEDEE